MQQRFRSKVDGKLAALGVALPVVTALVLLINGLSFGGPPWWTMIPLVLVALLFVWMLLSTWYGFEGGSLLVHCGPFNWRILLEQIFAVSESDSVRSGPALSMDRLEIRFGDDRRILISPEDKAGFLEALRHQAPQLRPQGRTPRPGT